jgi:hypothetical protein
VLAGEDALRDAPPEVSLPIGRTVTLRVEEGLASFRVAGYTDDEEHTLLLTDVQLVGG